MLLYRNTILHYYRYLDNNQIEIIPVDAFESKTRLEYMYLSNNYIRHIPAFPTATSSLEYLYLENNDIETVDPHAFLNLNGTINTL